MLTNNKNRMRKQLKKKKLSSTDKLVVLNEEELIRQVSMRPVIYDRSLKAYRKTSLRIQCWAEISEAMDAPVEECRKRWRSLRDSFAKHYKLSQRTDNAAKRHKWVFYDKMTFLIPHLEGVSYELDKILDELGDISEDGQSINCESVAIDTTNEPLAQNEQSLTNTHEVEKRVESHNANIQHSSVSVQATDLMSITMDNPHQQTMHLNNTNAENNITPCPGFSRSHHSCTNHNASTLGMQCGDTSNDNCGLLDSDEKFLLSCASTLRRLTYKQNALARLKIQQILFDIEFQQENN